MDMIRAEPQMQNDVRRASRQPGGLVTLESECRADVCFASDARKSKIKIKQTKADQTIANTKRGRQGSERRAIRLCLSRNNGLISVTTGSRDRANASLIIIIDSSCPHVVKKYMYRPVSVVSQKQLCWTKNTSVGR